MKPAPRNRGGSGACILMVGTAFDTRGGVSAVVNMYRRHGLFERWPILYVATHGDGSAARKLLLAARGLLVYVGLLLRRRVAVVHVHSSSGLSFWRKLPFILIAWAARKPFIFHLHGGGFDAFYSRVGAGRRRLIRFVLDHADRVVVLSSQWSRWMQSTSTNRRVTCIHNPVASQGAPDWQGIQGRLLFLGRLNRDKGIYDLLEVLAGLAPRHPGLCLVCAGDGEAAQVGARAHELGIGGAVTTPGWISPQARDELISASTVLVLPSYFEGLPMSVLEAMAAGMPVVTTPVGGLPDLVEDGVDGFMVPPGDKAALSRVLDRLLADCALQKRIGMAARRKVQERFSAEVVVPQLEKLYAELRVAPSSAGAGAACAAQV